MTKIFTFFLILKYTIILGQFTEFKSPNNSWDIYPETNISYPNGKEDLKEVLTIQSLLAENRIDEVFEMMDKFGYILLPDSENIFHKYNSNKENEMQPFIIIENTGNNKNFYENYITVTWALGIKKDEGISYDFNPNYKQARRMYNIVIKLFPLGNSFTLLKSTWNKDMRLDKNITMDWVDKYTVKLISPEKSTIYKASNFFKNPFMAETKGYSTIMFQGPGKAESTTIYVADFSTKLTDKGKYRCPTVKFFSSISNISKTFKPESRKPFNIEFFMSLENFNDRIWSDRQ